MEIVCSSNSTIVMRSIFSVVKGLSLQGESQENR